MKHINRASNYEKYPTIKMEGAHQKAVKGYEGVAKELHDKKVIVIDCYPGTDVERLISEMKAHIHFDVIIHSDEIFYDGDKLNELMKGHLTDDRVRGVMYYGRLEDFVDEQKLVIEKERVEKHSGEKILVCGVGASFITKGDVLVYADMARWEIQKRYRNGMPNFKQENYEEEALKKNKRGFFVEWRVADKHKRTLYEAADYWLDANDTENPKMVSGTVFLESLEQAVNQPFRTVPYFDPGVWGGQWMKTVCDLDDDAPNYAWSFDGVPEENSVLFDYDGIIFETPAMNITLHNPLELLGKNVYTKFGAEFPIRFDLLDTIDGQNLSLQVHPTLDQIRSLYGMPYTQEESYYMLDATDDAVVYLGMKENVDKDAMLEDFKRAAAGEISFPAEEYVNTFPVKRNDHILIPPGTIHCSGTGCMVLEISASAYIFTFKLWDWDRVDLNGMPRPIHLEEGAQALDFTIDKTVAENELLNQFELLSQDETSLEEKTGLHASEFIETRRYTMTGTTEHDSTDNVHMLNLVDGEEIIVESPDNAFAPFVIHYAETFIVPANVGKYTMRPYGKSEGKEVKVLKAFVKQYQ